MKREFLIFIALVLFLVLISSNKTYDKLIYFDGKNVSLLVKIADTEDAREKGLMFVNKLGDNEGMLFIFPHEFEQTFWMKNMLIPLDMIFASANGTVVGIIENAAPCKKDPCETYSVEADSKYVIEVNAGFAKKNGISLGSILHQ